MKGFILTFQIANTLGLGDDGEKVVEGFVKATNDISMKTQS